MSKITQVFEDLASGRPIKKPVKSNLLKARKDANEKALKSGFMKMPDYARKKFDEEKEEEYKPHYMYKGDKKVYAKKKEDHDKLNKQGYDHDDPKTKKIEEGKKGLWDNIHARRKKGLPPKKPGQEGYPKTLDIKEDMSGMSQKSGDKRPTDKGAGMTAKGVAKYNRRTGGNLKTAVTTPPSKLKKGSKAANRRKSFCARSRGWTGERGKAARRRWNC